MPSQNSVSHSGKLRPDRIDISSFSPPKNPNFGYQAIGKKQYDPIEIQDKVIAEGVVDINGES